MVLEHLEGTNLRQATGDRRVAPARAVELVVPVVRALVRAHERATSCIATSSRRTSSSPRAAPSRCSTSASRALLVDAEADTRPGSARTHDRLGRHHALHGHRAVRAGAEPTIVRTSGRSGSCFTSSAPDIIPCSRSTQEALLRQRLLPRRALPSHRRRASPDRAAPARTAHRPLPARNGRSGGSPRRPRRCSAELEPLLPRTELPDAVRWTPAPYPGLAAFQEDDARALSSPSRGARRAGGGDAAA